MNQTPEMRLLLACARRFAGTQSAAAMREQAACIADWDSFMDLARAHWMEPLAAWYLGTECAELLPAETLPRLRGSVRASAVSNLALRAELLKVLRILAQHRVQTVPLKGPVLAAMLCDEIPWRESADLDLLVRRVDITRAKDALLEAGYKLDSHLPSGEENATFHWRSQLVLFRDGFGPALDLHWQLLPSLFPAARQFDSVWERLETAAFHDEQILTLCPEDQLFFLCAHAARHSWQSLRLAADIARLIHVQLQSGLDWDRLIRAARSSDGGRILALGLWMVNRLLEVPLPEPAARYVNITIDKPFAQTLLDRLLTMTPDQYETSSEFALQFKLAAGWWPKLRCATAFALLPTNADGQSLALPKSLSLLYYLYRPIRLALKHGATVLQLSSGKPGRTAGIFSASGPE